MISGVYFKIIWRLWGPGQPGHTWDPGRQHRVPGKAVADTTQAGPTAKGKYLTFQPVDKMR